MYRKRLGAQLFSNLPSTMRSLQVALEDGFTEDTVILRLGGIEVYRRQGLGTRMQVGLADMVNLQVEGEPAELEISIPNRGVESRVTLSWAGHENLHVRVSLRPGPIVEAHTSEEPRGYA